ncbi:MFS transporter [Microbacterium oryzae]|uniref:MFS transporter n=1 Tax=Microbacterium oryzae TaxID=743009 RepID=UPI0025AEFA18|nr:MFS transporter [Microbacterium oryzae]MDN3310245.1 MFS transporter [Microbacterium oryzae]
MNAHARRTGWMAALVFLVALCLRPAITSVGPVLAYLGADTGLGEGTLGILTALPLLAFAAVSPLVHRMAARFGDDRAVLVALGVLVVATVVRSYAGDAGLWIGTFAIGAAIAVGNVLTPVLVRRDYPERVSLATGFYTAFLTLAAATGSALSVPLAHLVDWRFSLVVWAGLALLVALAWLPRMAGPAVHSPALEPVPVPHHPSIWRWGTAWLATVYMGLQSTTFYVLATWLPTIETSWGVPAATAGLHVSFFLLLGVLGGLLIPRLLRDGRDQAPGMLAATAPLAVGTAGMLLWPDALLLWLVLLGLAQGASLVAALTMLSLRARSHGEAAKLSGMAQSIGYLLAAAGPFAAGFLAEQTGSWTPTLVLLAVLTTTQTIVGVVLGRGGRR